MTVEELKQMLNKYSDNSLIIIEHIEGYISPNTVKEIPVKSTTSDYDKDYFGDYKYSDRGFNCVCIMSDDEK
jgi:hypothetical protein